MAAYLWRKRLVLVKPEVTYGVDSAPVAANVIQIAEASISPLEGGEENRNLVRPTFGASPSIPVNSHVKIEMTVNAAGSGAAGTPPAYGPLLRACGLAEVASAGVDVVYTPVSTGFESVSVYFNLDGVLHKALGCMGDLELPLEGGKIPSWKFTLTGLWAGPVAQAAPAVSYAAFKDPLPVSKTNTPTCTLFGVAAAAKSLSFKLGNSVNYRNLIGYEAVGITDRSSAGSINLELPPLATKDFIAAAKNAELGALALTHGVAAGNIVSIAAPKVQIRSPKYGEDQGVTMLQAELSFTPDAGSDEIAFTFS